MKILLSWLKEFVDVDTDPAHIAHILTMAGLEVDALEDVLPCFEGVVIAKVTKTRPHPSANKLCLATVFDGQQENEVVCGAPNCREGLVTALARVGAKLYEEDGKAFKIKESKIRGERSCGMLCSGKELRISEDSVGILEFDETMTIGTDLASELSDVIFDISLTPNLNYCASVAGVAREIGTLLELPFTMPWFEAKENAADKIEDRVNVTVKDVESCPRYTCRIIRDVQVGPSPGWLQRRLTLSGLRPVNNVVDITNYVLLEFGLPLHAFDYEKIQGQQLVIRKSTPGEVFTTLDDVERTLPQDCLMICDASRPIAIAGIMGGQNTRVETSTQHVLLEAAYFNPTSIRRSSKKLNLQSDASKRFERGADPNSVIIALNRAAEMIRELTGGTVCEGFIDVKNQNFVPKKISCRLERVNLILGTQLSLSEVENIFSRLNFTITSDLKNTIHVEVPTYRTDISIEIDLIEEVARVYGYNNLSNNNTLYTGSNIGHAPLYLFEKKVRERLLGEGLQEFISCDLSSPDMLSLLHRAGMPEESVVKIRNPMSVDHSVLRPSLLPGAFHIIKHNLDHNNPDICGFEIGNIHFKEGANYIEHSCLALMLTGKRRPSHWEQKAEDTDFFDIKGILENLLSSLGLSDFKFKLSEFPNFHPGRQASLVAQGHEIGIIGEIHPETCRKLNIDKRMFFAEVNLHLLMGLHLQEPRMVPLASFPASERDWTVTLTSSISIDTVFKALKKTHSQILECVTLKDVYTSKELGSDRRNVTFHFLYRDAKKTLSYESVEAEHQRITEGAKAHIA